MQASLFADTNQPVKQPPKLNVRDILDEVRKDREKRERQRKARKRKIDAFIKDVSALPVWAVMNITDHILERYTLDDLDYSRCSEFKPLLERYSAFTEDERDEVKKVLRG